MSKVKMPLPYLSFSAYDLFNRDPLEFYQQYFVFRVDRATAKMTLGKIFQEAWSDRKYKYAKELEKAGFTSNHERIIRTALNHPRTIRLPKNQTEKRYTVKGGGLRYTILGIFDGEQATKKVVIENKFGAVWTQQMADESEQLTWYALITKLKKGYIPKFVLQSFNAKNGIPKIIETKRYQYDLDKLVYRINKMVEKVEAGDFTR